MPLPRKPRCRLMCWERFTAARLCGTLSGAARFFKDLPHTAVKEREEPEPAPPEGAGTMSAEVGAGTAADDASGAAVGATRDGALGVPARVAVADIIATEEVVS